MFIEHLPHAKCFQICEAIIPPSEPVNHPRVVDEDPGMQRGPLVITHSHTASSRMRVLFLLTRILVFFCSTRSLLPSIEFDCFTPTPQFKALTIT